MTNALEGRTYIISREHESFYDYDHDKWSSKTVEQTGVVPNGKWVMEQPYGWAWLNGVGHDEIECLYYIDKDGCSRTLCISDKPFGFTVADEEDVDQSVYPGVPNGRRRLIYARQIHKGELGQGVPFDRLPYVRQAFEEGQKPSVTSAHQRRRGYGWVRLDDLVDATGLDRYEIVFGYWDYSGHRNYPGYNKFEKGGMLLDIVNAVSAIEIQRRTPHVWSLTQNEAYERLSNYSDCWSSPSEIWVRRGFAFTVLRLQALGVQPHAVQTQSA